MNIPYDSYQSFATFIFPSNDSSTFDQLIEETCHVQKFSKCTEIHIWSISINFILNIGTLGLQRGLYSWPNRILVITIGGKNDFEYIFRTSWTYRMMNAVLMMQNTDNEQEFFYGRCIPFPMTIEKWTTNSIKTLFKKEIYEAFNTKKYDNFQSSTVNMTGLSFAPFLIIKQKLVDGVVRTELGGRDGKIFSVLAEQFNFQLNLLESKSWKTSDEMLMSGISMFSPVFHTMFSQRIQNFSLITRPDRNVKKILLKQTGVDSEYFGLAKPLSSRLWLAIFGITICTPVLLKWIFSRKKSNIQMVALFLEVIRTFTTQPLNTKIWHQNIKRSRPLSLTFIIAGFIITTAYSTNLVAFLTLQDPPHRIKTIKEVLDFGLRVTTPPYGSIMFEDEQVMGNIHMRELSKRLIIVNSEEDAISSVLANGTGYIVNPEFVLLKIASNFTQENLYLTEEDVLGNSAGYPFPKHAPYIHNFEKKFHHIYEAGLEKKWLCDTYSESTKKGNGPNAAQCTLSKITRRVPVGFTIAQLKGAFILFVLGCLTSMIVFVFELIQASNWLNVNSKV